MLRPREASTVGFFNGALKFKVSLTLRFNDAHSLTGPCVDSKVTSL